MSLKIFKNDVLIFNKHVSNYIYKGEALPEDFLFKKNNYQNDNYLETNNYFLSCIVLENLISLGFLNSAGVIVNHPDFGSPINLLYLLPKNFNINLNSKPNFDVAAFFFNVLNYFKALFQCLD